MPALQFARVVSRLVKDDLTDMAGASSALTNLRPVTFHYTSDQNPTSRTLRCGIIAEGVAEVCPGLVAHSADGQIETVIYQFLPPMLLNEVQKRQRTIDTQAAQLAKQAACFEATANSPKADNDALRAQTAALRQPVAALRDRKQ